MREVVSSPGAPAAIGPYSAGVRAGNLLFLSGSIPLDPATGQVVPGDIAAQATRAMENIKALLTAAGADFANVVKTTVFLAPPAPRPGGNRSRRRPGIKETTKARRTRGTARRFSLGVSGVLPRKSS